MVGSKLILPENSVVTDFKEQPAITHNRDPETGELVEVDHDYATIFNYDYINNEYPGPEENFGLDQTTLSDYSSLGSCSVSAEFYTNNFLHEFSFEAISTDPSRIESVTSIDLIGFLEFTGTLDGFGYHYDFTGIKDSENDELSFHVQIEIRTSDYETVYSDYDPNFPTFRQKFVKYFDFGGGNVSGDVFFSYAELGLENMGVEDWVVSWDFVGVGKDRNGPSHFPDPVRLESTFDAFTTIQTAYDSIPLGQSDAMKVKAGDQGILGLDFDRNVSVVLEGGYDDLFENVISSYNHDWHFDNI